MTKIFPSNICSALDNRVIGSAVIAHGAFLDLVERAVEAHDTTHDAVPGQHYLELPPSACKLVSCGVGPRSPRPEDYVVRVHRGRVEAFLKREHASRCASVAVVVYERLAYLASPDLGDEEATRVGRSDCTHVLVAVLASSGVPSPLSPHRLVANLAGGNAEAALWDAATIREKAVESNTYDAQWAVVAD
jgi:hypothetical protein